MAAYNVKGNGRRLSLLMVSIRIGNAEDRNVPTLVQSMVGHKIVGVELGSGDAHTLALEENGTFTTTLVLASYPGPCVLHGSWRAGVRGYINNN